jgi:hypothetical protein
MERAEDDDASKHIGEKQYDTPSIDRVIVESADKVGDAGRHEANRYEQQGANKNPSAHVYLVRADFIGNDGLAVCWRLFVHSTLHSNWQAIARRIR